MKRYLSTARRIAEKSTHPRYRFGAVLTRGGSVLATAVNENKKHATFGSGFGGTLHAESRLILTAVSAGIKTTGATIHIFRVGDLPSEPCHKCMELIKAHGIKKICTTRKITKLSA